jgi:hypothetical protein
VAGRIRSTQPLTGMSTRSRKIMFLRSRERPMCRANNLAAICEPTVLDNVGSSTSHNPPRPVARIAAWLISFSLGFKSPHSLPPMRAT